MLHFYQKHFPLGQVQIKEESCSCDFRYDGNFINCDDRPIGPKGPVHMVGNSSESKLYDDSDISDFGNFHDFELFTHIEFLNTINVGRITPVYSIQTVNEPFFLCHLIEKNTNA